MLRRQNDSKIQWLASQPWWGELKRDELTSLAKAGDRSSIPAGRWFMKQGQRGQEAAVIVTGEVEIVRDDEVLARVGPGEVVGELSMLAGHPKRNAGVRTATDVELLVFSVTSFQELMHEIPPVRQQVLAAAERHRG